MLSANRKDRNRVLKELQNLLVDNESANFWDRQDKRANDRIVGPIDHLFTTCLRFGEAWLFKNMRAAVALLYIRLKRRGGQSIGLRRRELTQARSLSAIILAFDRQAASRAKRTKEARVYSWSMSMISPAHYQHICSKLLRLIVVRPLKCPLPLDLETSAFNTRQLRYELLCFLFYDYLNFDFIHHALVREPDKL